MVFADVVAVSLRPRQLEGRVQLVWSAGVAGDVAVDVAAGKSVVAAGRSVVVVGRIVAVLKDLIIKYYDSI